MAVRDGELCTYRRRSMVMERVNAIIFVLGIAYGCYLLSGLIV